ncbi:MAG: EscU/YscU/HrcU family type III secretion system export apparatus switch protein [Deltaproteobacteria bacterium]|nr:EscU/YscU/HrcU family type III secretion system export apparatus switch protein [Deltaproteobacteria bacterium]
MAEDDIESKTEAPTDRRLQELARLGQLHLSSELGISVAFLVGVIALYFILPRLFFTVLYFTHEVLSKLGSLSTENLTVNFLSSSLGEIILLSVFIMVIFPTISLVIGFLQTQGNIKEQWFAFNLETINPVTGMKRILSLQNMFQFSKALGKLFVLGVVLYFACKQEITEMLFSKNSNLSFWQEVISWSSLKVLIKGSAVILIFGILDYAIGYLLWLRRNRMTKQEVKDDKRAAEGDELTKKTIFSRSSKRILQQIKKNVARATVVVTNPTHYAVALRYERGIDDAPVVVAKGIDFIALKIREIAREHKVPIVERPYLARTLYARVKIGETIPNDLFRALAEVIAFVYKLQKKFNLKK